MVENRSAFPPYESDSPSPYIWLETFPISYRFIEPLLVNINFDHNLLQQNFHASQWAILPSCFLGLHSKRRSSVCAVVPHYHRNSAQECWWLILAKEYAMIRFLLRGHQCFSGLNTHVLVSFLIKYKTSDTSNKVFTVEIYSTFRLYLVVIIRNDGPWWWLRDSRNVE